MGFFTRGISFNGGFGVDLNVYGVDCRNHDKTLKRCISNALPLKSAFRFRGSKRELRVGRILTQAAERVSKRASDAPGSSVFIRT
jgi:hypothetical protein